MIERILVPTDFSEGADAALEHAAQLARATGSELLLLHVREAYPLMTPEGFAFAPPGLDQELRAALQRALDQKVEKLREHGVRARGLLSLGATHMEIERLAQHEHADMVVMGTHGRRGLPRFLLGSVADRVAREAVVPVLVVRSDARG